MEVFSYSKPMIFKAFSAVLAGSLLLTSSGLGRCAELARSRPSEEREAPVFMEGTRPVSDISVAPIESLSLEAEARPADGLEKLGLEQDAGEAFPEAVLSAARAVE